MDLVTFLMARIGEDEEAARAARFNNGKWHRTGQFAMATSVALDFGPDVVPEQVGSLAWDNNGHIARWDPARVLTECEAKRRIVELHEPTFEYPGAAPMCGQCGSGRQASGPGDPGDFEPEPWPCPTLDLLALPYAAHSDYQPEWRPEETAHQ